MNNVLDRTNATPAELLRALTCGLGGLRQPAPLGSRPLAAFACGHLDRLLEAQPARSGRSLGVSGLTDDGFDASLCRFQDVNNEPCALKLVPSEVAYQIASEPQVRGVG